MTELKNKIQEDLKDSMKKGETLAVSVLRMLLAAVHNKEIELGKKDKGLSDDETMDIIKSEAKKRKDAIAVFARANRSELAEQEKKELNILESYLPAEISDEELSSEVKKAITESQAQSPADFGKAMKILAPLLKGKASGNRIADAVKNALSC